MNCSSCVISYQVVFLFGMFAGALVVEGIAGLLRRFFLDRNKLTKRAVDGATVCPNCGNEQVGAFGCCACGWHTPRN